MKNISYILTLASFVMLASCTENKTEKQSENHGGETEHHDEHENTNTATLTEEQIKSIGIEYGSIEKKQLTSSLKLNGLLRVPNNNQASVTSLFGGVINRLPIQQGNTVRKGQVLATLSNTNFIIMQEEFLTVFSKLTLAEIEYERQLELQQGNATSVKNYKKLKAH